LALLVLVVCSQSPISSDDLGDHANHRAKGSGINMQVERIQVDRQRIPGSPSLPCG